MKFINRNGEYDDYDDYRTGGAIKGGHPVSKNSKFYLTYRYEMKEILNVDSDVTSPIILDAEGESTLSSITAEWVRNSTDYYQDPSTGGDYQTEPGICRVGRYGQLRQGECGTSAFLPPLLENGLFRSRRHRLCRGND